MEKVIYMEYWLSVAEDGGWYARIRSGNWRTTWIPGQRFGRRSSVVAAIERFVEGMRPRANVLIREIGDPNAPAAMWGDRTRARLKANK